MAVLGAALGRKVWFDFDDINKSRITWPMLNVLFLGPSGIGKSSAVRAALELLKALPPEERPQIISGKATTRGLHEELSNNPHAIVFASELANLFSKDIHSTERLSYVTDLLDYRDEVALTTRWGRTVVTEPAVCFLGGSTIEWLLTQLPKTAMAGGFLPRFLPIKEDRKACKNPYGERGLTDQEREILRTNRDQIFEDFKELANFHHGQMDFADPEAQAAWGTWYTEFNPESGPLQPFAARAGEYVIRLSVLLAISRGQHAISAEDIQTATTLHGYVMERLHEVVASTTFRGKMLDKILQIVGNGEVSEAEIKRGMRNYLGARDVEKLLESLVSSEDVVSISGLYRSAETS